MTCMFFFRQAKTEALWNFSIQQRLHIQSWHLHWICCGKIWWCDSFSLDNWQPFSTFWSSSWLHVFWTTQPWRVQTWPFFWHFVDFSCISWEWVDFSIGIAIKALEPLPAMSSCAFRHHFVARWQFQSISFRELRWWASSWWWTCFVCWEVNQWFIASIASNCYSVLEAWKWSSWWFQTQTTGQCLTFEIFGDCRFSSRDLLYRLSDYILWLTMAKWKHILV